MSALSPSQPISSVIADAATVSDVIQEIWERVLDGSFSDPATAARAMRAHLSVSAAARDELALNGLIELAKHSQRITRRASQPAIGYGAPHGRRWQKYIALTWPFEAADGSQRSLVDFTSDDLAAFAFYNGKMENAYARRRVWALETFDLLAKHGVLRVRDLPGDVLAAVEASARESMGRQE